LIREIKDSFTVDAFVGNVTDWERVCLGNLVGMPVVVVPTGLKSIQDPPKGGTTRRTTVTTGIYAPPDHDHIVSFLFLSDVSTGRVTCQCLGETKETCRCGDVATMATCCIDSHFLAGSGAGNGVPVRH
jgi:hypothetical protein